MIAAAIKSTAASPTSLSWFDVVLVLVLAFGLFRGRRNGMGRELVPTLMWITLVVVSGLGYSMAGQVFVNAAGMGKTLSYILAYVILAFVVYLIFSLINRAVTAKLAASNTFGSGEYYLGMPAGMIRFACILLALLALLNAPSYSAADAAAHKAYVAQTYGGGESGFSGDFFPSLQSIQEQVFKTSLTGPYIKTYFDPVLINVGPPDAKGLKPGVPPPKHPVIHMGN
jgi:uncharacterized membrane protein required for colicin V production